MSNKTTIIAGPCVIESAELLDTVAQKSVRAPIDERNVEKGLIKVKRNTTELLRQLTQRGVTAESELYDAVMDFAGDLSNQVITRAKVARAELMATGKVTIKENNLDLTIDYGVPAANLAKTLDLGADAAEDPATQLQELYNSDENVRHNIDYDANGGYWGQSWFLAQGVSTHNTGSALDVSLVDINTGEEVSMQCPMHELSTQALKTGGDDLSYVFGEAGMVGIASEWWHFQDDTGHSRILSRTGALDIQFTSISSVSVEQVYAYMMGDESQVPVSY